MEGRPTWEEEDTLEAEEDSGTAHYRLLPDYGNYRFIQRQRPRWRIRRTPLDGTPHMQVLPRRLLQVRYTLSIGRGVGVGVSRASNIPPFQRRRRLLVLAFGRGQQATAGSVQVLHVWPLQEGPRLSPSARRVPLQGTVASPSLVIVD